MIVIFVVSSDGHEFKFTPGGIAQCTKYTEAINNTSHYGQSSTKFFNPIPANILKHVWTWCSKHEGDAVKVSSKFTQKVLIPKWDREFLGKFSPDDLAMLTLAGANMGIIRLRDYARHILLMKLPKNGEAAKILATNTAKVNASAKLTSLDDVDFTTTGSSAS